MEKDTNFFEEYSLLIGLVLLGFVSIILFSTPSSILASSITTIDTELSHASGDAMPVRTKVDCGLVCTANFNYPLSSGQEKEKIRVNPCLK